MLLKIHRRLACWKWRRRVSPIRPKHLIAFFVVFLYVSCQYLKYALPVISSKSDNGDRLVAGELDETFMAQYKSAFADAIIIANNNNNEDRTAKHILLNGLASKGSLYGSKKLTYPSMLKLVPHLQSDGVNRDISPRLHISGGRRAKFVIGIPTTKRPETYLYIMLMSLLRATENTIDTNPDKLLIVIQISELTDVEFIETTVSTLRKLFGAKIDAGLIDIIVPPVQFYPDPNGSLSSVEDHIFNDTRERFVWRVIQNYDVNYLMNYCHQRGTYYLQLEDDVLSSDGFLDEVDEYIDRLESGGQTQWKMIEFSSLGFIGKLFRTRDLPIFMHMIMLFATYRPVDLIHQTVLEILACDPTKVKDDCNRKIANVRLKYTPSLFQHIGQKSSLVGKIQKLKDISFVGERRTPSARHSNPPAYISTSLSELQIGEHTIQAVYAGDTFFWANETVLSERDYVLVQFIEPFLLTAYRIRSGNSLHLFDRMPVGSSLSVKPHRTGSARALGTVSSDGFIEIQRLKRPGDLTGRIDSTRYGAISQLRLNFARSSRPTRLLISELGLY